jgi:aconitate hydratase
MSITTYPNGLQEYGRPPVPAIGGSTFGFWFSRTGNGISHVQHMERFGRPGKTLLGSDSHTPAGGGIGMLAIGTGGLDVALAAAGEPYYVKMKIMGKTNWKITRLGECQRCFRNASQIRCDWRTRLLLEYYGPGLKR